MRRKMSKLDKICIHNMSKIFTPNIQEIVFSSEFGEFDTLNTLVQQYLINKEVSPTKFSVSVHNNINGMFALLNKLNSSYVALSAGKSSLSAGLVKSILSKSDNVLFCYGDTVEQESGLACIISKNKTNISMKCKFSHSVNHTENNEFTAFKEFLNGKRKDFKLAYGIIERIDE